LWRGKHLVLAFFFAMGWRKSLLVGWCWLLGTGLGFPLIDKWNNGKWSNWLETRSIQITKTCVIWSLRFPFPRLKNWCKAHRHALRQLGQLGSIFGVLTCCMIMMGLVLSGIVMYLVCIACVITRSFFWRMDAVELAQRFPLISYFRSFLESIANYFLTPLLRWLYLGSVAPFWFLGLLGLLVTLCVHELGHAVIAFAEGIAVERMGIFLCFFIPGMFVTLEESLMDLNTKSRLGIFCAGFWFNIILCLLSLIILVLFLPLMVSPMFKQQIAVSGITPTAEHDKLTSLFSVGDELHSINNKEIRRLKDIKEAIRSLVLEETSFGICFNKDNMTDTEWFRPFHACCPGLVEDNVDQDMELSEWNCFVQYSFWNTDYPNAVCISDRWLQTQALALGSCPDEERQNNVSYFIPYNGKGGRLMALKRWIPREKVFEQTLLVATTPESLVDSIQWTEYVPRITTPHWLYLFVVKWNPIGIIENLLRLIVLLSAVIGMSNMAPVWRMDGEDIFYWIVYYFFPSGSSRSERIRNKILLVCFTVLFLSSGPLWLFVLVG